MTKDEIMNELQEGIENYYEIVEVNENNYIKINTEEYFNEDPIYLYLTILESDDISISIANTDLDWLEDLSMESVKETDLENIEEDIEEFINNIINVYDTTFDI